jgi:hypothetical protein
LVGGRAKLPYQGRLLAHRVQFAAALKALREMFPGVARPLRYGTRARRAPRPWHLRSRNGFRQHFFKMLPNLPMHGFFPQSVIIQRRLADLSSAFPLLTGNAADAP